MLTPKKDAINTSRTKPVKREANVNSETVEADLKSGTHRAYALIGGASALPPPFSNASRAELEPAGADSHDAEQCAFVVEKPNWHVG